MKRLLSILTLIIALMPSALYAQEAVETPADAPFVRTSSQKGVGISTDVLSAALPAATLAYILITHDWQGLKQAAFSGLTTFGITYLLKFTVHKRRPDGSNYHSFPSMHTAGTFATATFLTRRYGWKFGVPAYAVASYVGWGRTYAKKHDWWDVLAGAAIGAGSSLIYTRPWAKKHELTIDPYFDGKQFDLMVSFKF